MLYKNSYSYTFTEYSLKIKTARLPSLLLYHYKSSKEARIGLRLWHKKVPIGTVIRGRSLTLDLASRVDS